MRVISSHRNKINWRKPLVSRYTQAWNCSE